MAWSGTLAAPIGPDDESIIVNPAYNPSRWGRLLIIDAAGDPSIVAVRGASTGGLVLFVDRGLLGSERTAHAAGVTVAEYSAATSTGGAHPNLATHDSLGLATQAELDTHAASPHGGGAHPDLATHDSLGLATDAELTTHAGTAHGTQAHAISGVSHTGTLDHSALGSITANQHHNQDHASRHATAGADPMAAADIGAAVTGHNHDAAYEATGAVSTHAGAADPHTAYQKESEKGSTNGYASLDGSGLVPDAQIPAAIARDSELHTQAHSIGGADHTGTLAHSALGSVSADQHHAQLHAAAHLSGGNDAIFAETVPTTAVFGDTAAQGADATKVAKLLHRHGMPANPVTAHEAAGDPHTGYVREADANWVDLTDGGATTLHSHSGGGSSPWTLVPKLADESKNNSAVVADDNALVVTLLANTQYIVRLRASFLTNATADLKYRLVFTGTTTRVRRLVRRTATTDIAQTIDRKTAFDAADVVLSTTGLNPWLEEDVILQVGVSGGSFKLQWGQVTSNAGPTTCLEGSYLEYAVT